MTGQKLDLHITLDRQRDIAYFFQQVDTGQLDQIALFRAAKDWHMYRNFDGDAAVEFGLAVLEQQGYDAIGWD